MKVSNLLKHIHNKKRFAALTVCAVLTVAALSWWVASSPGDLAELAPYAERYNYERLEAGLVGTQDNAESFTFVVLGDTRNNMYVAPDVFRHAAEERPVMIFHTGDLIRGGTVKEYLENHIPLLEIADPVPVFCIPGNHERGDRRDFAAFEALYGGTRFSFDYGPCRFVGFNASEKIRVTAGDLAFLEQELSKPGATYKFVFFHIPPKYFEGKVATNDRRGFDWNADKLRELLSRHHVNEVFMAHIHGYATAVIDGVRYTLTAGGGAPFSKRLPEEARIFHYMTIHVTPQGLSEELVYRDRDTGDWRRKAVY